MSDTTTVPEEWPTRTRTSKSGRPLVGTVIDIWTYTTDGWERARVIAQHGAGRMYGVEWTDGTRQPVDLDDVDWRQV